MDKPGAFILLFRGNEKDSRLDIKRFLGELPMPSIKNIGDLLSFDLGNGREVAVFTAAETLSPTSIAYLRMRQRNLFVSLPFPAGDERNLHFFQHMIDTLGITHISAVTIEAEWELCNQLLHSLSQLYPSVAFYMEVLPNEVLQFSDVQSRPPAAIYPLSLSGVALPDLPAVLPPSSSIDLEQNPPAQSIDEPVFCVVCQESFTEGLVTLCCCQVLCSFCYKRVEQRCPMCRASPLQAIEGVFDSNIAYKNDNIEDICTCGKAVKRRNRQFHEEKECPNRLFQCPGCHFSLSFASLSGHLREIHKEELLLALMRLDDS